MVAAQIHSEPRRVRLNVLLTQDRAHGMEHWTGQLPRLLEPQGVAAYVAASGRQAMQLAERVQFHAVIIDLGTPLETGSDLRRDPLTAGAKNPRIPEAPGSGVSGVSGGGASGAVASGQAGAWLVELLRKLPHRPPFVLVHEPVFSERQVQRMLTHALKLGAFSVLQKPVELPQLLEVFRRLLDRQYRGKWPERR